MKLGTLEVRNTRTLISPETRICALVVAPPKQGKTVLASSLDAITRKYRKKPVLFVASEVAEGGGTMSLTQLEDLKERGIEYVTPNTWQESEALWASLRTDEHFGGIVLDNLSDYADRIIAPYVLTFPCKEENSKFAGTRKHGVYQRTDYIPASEFARQHLNKLIALTREDIDARYRKDLIVTALEKERKSPDGDTVLGVKPKLPGQLGDGIPAMFQSVVAIRKEGKVIGAGTANSRRIELRTAYTGGDGLRPYLGDRTGMWPLEASLTDENGQPVGLLPLYEAWLAKMQAQAA